MSKRKIPPTHSYLESFSSTLFSAAQNAEEECATYRDETPMERGFLNWINFELAQLEDVLQNNFSREIDDYDVNKHNHDMASKLISGQKISTLENKLFASNHENGTNENLFLNSPFPYFRSKLQKEFECKRIALSATLNFYYDVVAREDVVSMFTLTYSEWWLRFGLEVLSGNYFHPSEYPNIRKVFLDVIFPASNVAHKLGFSQSAILNALLLIYLLDLLRSKMHSLQLSAPRLLFKEKDFLNLFCKKILQPQGDIVRQFSLYGAVFAYTQKPCDAVAYHISQLSLDLRDGIQLSRLLAKVTSDSSFLSLPMKVLKPFHLSNMSSIFRLLRERGFSFQVLNASLGSVQEIETKDIVDGHKEKTIAFLFKIVCSWKVPALISHSSLQKEITLLYEKKPIKETPPSSIELREVHCQLADAKAGHLSLLFEWCWIIGQVMNKLPVHDFSSSFADGRLFSALLLHYESCGKRPPPQNNWMHFFIKSMEGRLPSIISKEALMSSPRHCLDEKVVLFLLSYLCCLFLEP